MTSLNSSFTNSTKSPENTLGLSHSIGIAILSIAFIIGFPGNAFVIWTVLIRMKKRTVTCLLILHLALADIIVILTAPVFLHLLATGSWAFGNIICKVCHYISCLSMYASILLISVMSIDRLLAVKRPLHFLSMRTKRIVKNIVMSVWILASLLAIPMPIFRAVESNRNRQQCIPFHNTSGHLIFQYMFETMTGFVIPFTIIMSCYLCLGLRLQTLKLQNKHKTNWLVTMIVVIFALFWLPYHVVNIIQVSGELYSSEKLRAAARIAKPNVTALAFLSSSINPVLYTFAGGNFIKTTGMGFMGKLFEGIGSESKSLHNIHQVGRLRSQDRSMALGNINN